MSRRIILNGKRLKDKYTVKEYLMELLLIDGPTGTNLDAYYDVFSEYNEEIIFILKHDEIQEIINEPYAYKFLLLLGRAAEENPNIKILFR